LSTIKNVDRVFVLDQGKIIEDGSYSALRQDDRSRFREMVDIQSL